MWSKCCEFCGHYKCDIKYCLIWRRGMKNENERDEREERARHGESSNIMWSKYCEMDICDVEDHWHGESEKKMSL